MVAQDVQCNAEEPPQRSFVSDNEPTPVQGEMVT